MTKTELVKFRITKKDKDIIERAADIVGLSVSDFMRVRLIETARAIILVCEERISEDDMVSMEKTMATHLSRDAATADT